MSFILSVFLTLCYVSKGLDNGLARTPPMGWRSWNAYGHNINQDQLTDVINAMLDTSREINGKYQSLSDIGYITMGVDDLWQQCNADYNYFHNDSAPNGWANINFTRFYDLQSMIDYAHDKKMYIGWYFNNCQCHEGNGYPANEANDVKFLRHYDLDSVKIDHCGSSKNISNWVYLINTTGNGRPLIVENCLLSYAYDGWCDMNLYRISGDIKPSYPLIIGQNLQGVIDYTKQYPTGFLSYPGCWAYPDMLEVGNMHDTYNAKQNDMDQSHFNAWCVVSSPLTLSFDMTNEDTISRVWNTITNTEAIAVNQNWADHPGRQISKSDSTVTYYNIYYNNYTIPIYEIWAKPQPNNTWAVLLMNGDGYNTHNITVNFNDIPWNADNTNIRDINNHIDLGSTSATSYTAINVRPFGNSFILLSEA